MTGSLKVTEASIYRVQRIMTCWLQVRDVSHSPQIFTTFIQFYSILIGALNISGNGTLIWALRRTRQTKSSSFQFIMIMSCSDLITGIISLVLLPSIFAYHHQSSCWQKLTIQFVLFTCNFLSVFMLLLIALDRYLHMKYLEKYSLIVTKKRGHYAIIVSALLAISISAVTFMQISEKFHMIMQFVSELFMSSLLISVIVMYYAALRALRRNAHKLTGSIIDRNRALGRAAKRISICILVLSTPLAVLVFLDNAGLLEIFFNATVVNSCIWVGYATFLGNGFCSSIIFISQNRPIKRLLKRVAMKNLNRIRPMAQVVDTQV